MEKAKMEKAFSMVCPAEHAKKLVAKGLLSAENAAKVSWRDAIGAIVTDAELESAGVTIAEVAEAIRFYTACEPKVSRERIAMECRVGGRSEPGYLVIAAGYRAGPAGP